MYLQVVFHAKNQQNCRSFLVLSEIFLVKLHKLLLPFHTRISLDKHRLDKNALPLLLSSILNHGKKQFRRHGTKLFLRMVNRCQPKSPVGSPERNYHNQLRKYPLVCADRSPAMPGSPAAPSDRYNRQPHPFAREAFLLPFPG